MAEIMHFPIFKYHKDKRAKKFKDAADFALVEDPAEWFNSPGEAERGVADPPPVDDSDGAKFQAATLKVAQLEKANAELAKSVNELEAELAETKVQLEVFTKPKPVPHTPPASDKPVRK